MGIWNVRRDKKALSTSLSTYTIELPLGQKDSKVLKLIDVIVTNYPRDSLIAVSDLIFLATGWNVMSLHSTLLV